MLHGAIIEGRMVGSESDISTVIRHLRETCENETRDINAHCTDTWH
jgi:hypothetical protein